MIIFPCCFCPTSKGFSNNDRPPHHNANLGLLGLHSLFRGSLSRRRGHVQPGCKLPTPGYSVHDTSGCVGCLQEHTLNTSKHLLVSIMGHAPSRQHHATSPSPPLPPVRPPASALLVPAASSSTTTSHSFRPIRPTRHRSLTRNLDNHHRCHHHHHHHHLLKTLQRPRTRPAPAWPQPERTPVTVSLTAFTTPLTVSAAVVIGVAAAAVCCALELPAEGGRQGRRCCVLRGCCTSSRAYASARAAVGPHIWNNATSPPGC